MAPVNQHRQLNPPGPPKIIQRIHGRARRSPAEQDIVHQNDRFAGDIERDHCGMHLRSGVAVQIIAMHADIQAADQDGVVPDFLQNRRQAFGQENSAALHPDQRHFALFSLRSAISWAMRVSARPHGGAIHV